MSADNQNITLSIVIVNYNVRDLLENCLRSVYAALEGISNEVFVVDNKSSDGSVEMVRERFPQVLLTASQENLGFACGNNLALKQACGKYLLLLNPDTLVQEDTFRKMIAFCDGRPDVGMAGCKIINPDGTLEPACRRSFPSPWVSFGKLSGLSKIFPKSRLFARYNLTYLDENESYELDAISGSFMFLRREVFEQIGGLDEEYFMYGEDLDWCHRTQSAGWKLCYVPDTRIIHYGGISTKRSSINATAIFYEAMEVFSRKNLHVSKPALAVINLGIKLRMLFARFSVSLHTLFPLLLDSILVLMALTLAELWMESPNVPFFPAVLAVYASIIGGLAVAGLYSSKGFQILRSAAGMYIAAVIIALFGIFSPGVGAHAVPLAVTWMIALVVIPALRVLKAFVGRKNEPALTFGSPTLVVSCSDKDAEIIRLLRESTENTYDFIGIVTPPGAPSATKIAGLPSLGGYDALLDTIREYRITDVIFMPSSLRYDQILSITERARGLGIRFRVVSESREFIIGKSHIDHLNGESGRPDTSVSLRPISRFLKRAMDLVVGLPCLIAFLPFVYFSRSRKPASCSFFWFLNRLPAVVAGKMSLVGYPSDMTFPTGASLGKPGVTGLFEMRSVAPGSPAEHVALAVQYVQDHTIFLDVEILLRTMALCLIRNQAQAGNNTDN